MAYDGKLADRIRKALKGRRAITEKAMFGGISFLLDGKMFIGVLKNDIVARVNPEESDVLLKKAGVRPMDFTGRPMKGFLYIDPKGYKTAAQLKDWVNRTLAFVSSFPTKKKK